MGSRSLAVAGRVLAQLRRDHRFLALSLLVPVLILYLLKVFFDAFPSPAFQRTTVVVPVASFIVHFLTYVLTAIALVRERTHQTLTRMFVNGYRQGDIIVGYLLAYTTLATAQGVIVLTELSILFDLGAGAGRLLSIYLVIWLLAVISLSLGILVSNFARNEGQVLPMIPRVVIPSIFLSGLILPVKNLPAWARVLSRVTPLYYACNLLREVLPEGGSLFKDVGSLVGLPIYGLVVLSLAAATLRERD